MATLTDQGFPNLLNIMNRLRPDMTVETKVANRIFTKTPLFQDIPWKEANRTDGHKIIALTTRPAPSRRALNQGVDPGKSETLPYEEAICLFETHNMIDAKAAQLSGNANAYRMTENMGTMLGFKETIETAFWYDSVLTNPVSFHGFAPRYSLASGATTSPYVLKRGSHVGNDSESVYLIAWDEDYCCGLYPKGGVPGLQHKDLGPELVHEASSGSLTTRRFLALRDQYTWECGLLVTDHRYVVRAQFDPGDSANGFGDSGKGLYLLMQEMLDTIHDRQNPYMRFYLSRTGIKKLRAQMASNDANWLSQVAIPGTNFLVDHFGTVPMRVSDRLVPESSVAGGTGGIG